MAVPDLLAAALRRADPAAFWIGWSIASVATLALAARARAAFAARRAAEDTPTALIRSAAQGYTELRGMADLLDGEPIRAPASLRPCVWYRYRIQHVEEREIGRAHV